jgi:hypothetical protein
MVLDYQETASMRFLNEKSKKYPVESLGTQTGTLIGKRRMASEGDSVGFVTFGPYEHLEAGH